MAALNRFTPGPCNCDCGGTPPACSLTFTVRGCNGMALPGAVVTLTTSGVPTSTGTTGSDGKVTIGHGSASGTYSIAHPSGRFNTASGSFSSCQAGIPFPSSTPIVNLTAATGYSCCLSGTPYPAKFPLTVTPSSGAAFTLSNCGGAGCVNTTLSMSASGPSSIVCGAQTPTIAPASIAAGTVDLRISISTSPLVASVQYAGSAADFPFGTTCADVPASYPPNTIFWYRSGGCTGNLRDAGGSVGGVATVNSYSPMNVTFTFSGPRSPLSSITVTEAP